MQLLLKNTFGRCLHTKKRSRQKLSNRKMLAARKNYKNGISSPSFLRQFSLNKNNFFYHHALRTYLSSCTFGNPTTGLFHCEVTTEPMVAWGEMTNLKIHFFTRLHLTFSLTFCM